MARNNRISEKYVASELHDAISHDVVDGSASSGFPIVAVVIMQVGSYFEMRAVNCAARVDDTDIFDLVDRARDQLICDE